MAGAIFGDWTHRRADAGGTRALAADVARAKAKIAWTFEAPGGARIDQVRTSAGQVFVAAMVSSATGAPGWEHATLFALDGATGRVVARRRLPDPVPVAALVLEGHRVHVVATRPAEPVFWYGLEGADLAPVHRVAVPLAAARRTDVLDAWALPDGALWIEVETGDGVGGYVSLPGDVKVRDAGDATVDLRGEFRGAGAAGGVSHARDACQSGRSLFAPADTALHPDGRDALLRLEPDRGAGAERRSRPRRLPMGRVDAELRGFSAQALGAEGQVFAAATAQDGALVQVIAIDRTAGVERWKTSSTPVPVTGTGTATRLAYVSGEVVLQRLSAEGVPCSDLLFAGPRGAVEAVTLGAGRRFVLDAALGATLLVHRWTDDGRVLVAGFSAEGRRGLLGRRARMEFSVETPDVGGAPTVYAGAGRILVRGSRTLVAVAV